LFYYAGLVLLCKVLLLQVKKKSSSLDISIIIIE